MMETHDDPRPEGARTGTAAIDAALVSALYEEHGPELRRFILGVVRDPDLAGDVMQATFAKTVELGHTARAESLKSWLFQVAFHEAITARRRRESREQGQRRFAALGFHAVERPDEILVRGEAAEAVRKAIETLPPEQRSVVLARIHDDKTFAQIAEDKGLPLGTVLTRMRLALKKLRSALATGD